MEVSGRLLGVCSAPTEHGTTEWLESRRGNEKLVAIQLEPQAPFDAAEVRMEVKERWWWWWGSQGYYQHDKKIKNETFWVSQIVMHMIIYPANRVSSPFFKLHVLHCTAGTCINCNVNTH